MQHERLEQTSCSPECGDPGVRHALACRKYCSTADKLKHVGQRGRSKLTALKLRRTFFEERSRAFLFIVSSGAESKERRFERQTFGLTCFHSFIDRFDRIPNGDWCVGKDLPQECFRTRDKIGRRNDFVHQSDSISLLRANHSAGKNKLQCPPFSDQSRQTLGSAATGKYS